MVVAAESGDGLMTAEVISPPACDERARTVLLLDLRSGFPGSGGGDATRVLNLPIEVGAAPPIPPAFGLNRF